MAKSTTRAAAYAPRNPYGPRKPKIGDTSNFICRRCDRPSSIDFFRSKYDHVCMECYQADIREKNNGAVRKYGRLKYTAEKRGLALSITYAEYVELTRSGICHYCGNQVENTGSGIDRIDNARGYDLDNLVQSCKWCNAVKNEHYTYEEMLLLGEVIGKIMRARGESVVTRKLRQPQRDKAA